MLGAVVAEIIYGLTMVTEAAAPRSAHSLLGPAAWLCAGVLLGCAACSQTAEPPVTGETAGRAPGSRADAGTAQAGTPWFTDRAAEAGLNFVHFNGMSGRFYFAEVMPPGVALFDYDNDGDLDAYLVQGQLLDPAATLAQALVPPSGPQPLKGRLFRNDLTVGADGSRSLRFTDVTEASRIDARQYGMGVAAADIDNDGWVDLYLTHFGRNQLYRNNGEGTFSDISRASGTDVAGFSVSATFFDYDRDDRLDLFVGGYLDYSLDIDQACTSVTGGRGYCPPRVYRAQRDRLYHNDGGGRFTDVSVKALASGDYGPALGVVAADLNDDGWPDLYVANDGHENQLWINQKNGTFKNDALLAGVALTVDGQAEASMGVDAGDFDNDGDEDLLVTELTGEGSNLFVNTGGGNFRDESAISGLGPGSFESTGFGTAWADFDNDGWLDTLSVNGLVQIPAAPTPGPFPLGQRMLLFRNQQNGRFAPVGNPGAPFQATDVGRGAAFGDVDNDGDIDVLVGNNSGPTRLLVNGVGHDAHWVGLRLLGRSAKRDMLGARVDIVRENGPRLRRRVRADGSYGSASDPRVLAGLGASTERPTVRVTWPDGSTDEWRNVSVDGWTTLTQGGGR